MQLVTSFDYSVGPRRLKAHLILWPSVEAIGIRPDASHAIDTSRQQQLSLQQLKVNRHAALTWCDVTSYRATSHCVVDDDPMVTRARAAPAKPDLSTERETARADFTSVRLTADIDIWCRAGPVRRRAVTGRRRRWTRRVNWPREARTTSRRLRLQLQQLASLRTMGPAWTWVNWCGNLAVCTTPRNVFAYHITIRGRTSVRRIPWGRRCRVLIDANKFWHPRIVQIRTYIVRTCWCLACVVFLSCS